MDRRSCKAPTKKILEARLAETEELLRRFELLSPFKYRPFTKAFKSFADYNRWKNAQKNPWYR